MQAVLDNLKRYLSLTKNKLINNRAELQSFLNRRVGQAAAKLVMGYSQQRHGGKHFDWCKDKNYSDSLMVAQVNIHARMSTDLRILSQSLFKGINAKGRQALEDIFSDCHKHFKSSLPEKLLNAVEASPPNTADTSSLEEMAVKTGDYFYSILPMTENMNRGNVQIFQGQIRHTYIGIIDELRRKLESGAESASALVAELNQP